MDRTTAYAKLVVSGKRIVGETEIQCCKRHLGDMKKKDFPYIFDVKEAERHIEIANMMTILEGTESKPLKTRGFQNFIIGNLFGWRKKRSKERRYREAYIQVGRQNGKSFISGAIANDVATFSGYKKGKIYCTATKQAQANIVWEEVQKFIEADSDLKELYHIRYHDRVIASKITGTEIKSLGRDTKSADGFRSQLAIVDEYHAHQTNQMYKLMLDGQIKVDSALILAITTAGFDLNSPCYEQYQFCKKVLTQSIIKDTLFIYITEMDIDDDWKNKDNWAKANPLNLYLDDDITIDKDMLNRYAEKAIDAQEKGGEDLMNFLTKSLNQWVEFQAGAMLNMKHWKTCESELTIADFEGEDCYLGIDLSQGGDLTSIALVFPMENDEAFIYSQSFMPELRLEEHEKEDKAPYRMWAKKGHLILTSGMYGIKTDYKFIIAHLKQLIEKYNINIIECGYDNHNASTFLTDLDEILDCDLTDVPQSAKSLNDATVDFQQSVEARLIKYDKTNSLLNWSAANARLEQNSFGEKKIIKEKAGARIDPIYAIIDAWKLYFNLKEPTVDVNENLDDWFKLIKGGEK